MLSLQHLEEALKKHGSQKRAAAALHIAQSTFSETIAKLRAQSASAGRGEHKPGRSLVEFRAQYDRAFIVPKKIKEALKQLGDGWEYEVQFAKLAGVGLSDLGDFRDQFAEHIVVVRRDGKRAWAGTQALAAKMREMIR